MPRPFAIIGFMVFFVLASLYDAPSVTVLVVFLALVLLLVLSIIIKSLRKENGIHSILAAGAAACLLLLCVNEFYYVPRVNLADSQHSSVILITDEPEVKYGNYYYEATATEIDGEKADVKLRLTFFSEPGLSPYDEIEGNFYYYRLGTSSDSLLSSYKSQNRFIGAYSSDGKYKINKTDSHKPGRLVISLRSGIRKSIMTVLPNDYGALGTALVLGDKSYLSDEAYSAVRNAGVSHIICVSGLHLSLWSSAVLWLLKKLKIREKYACLLTIPAVVFIMILTGLTNSVCRAGIMMILYLTSKVLSQRNDSLNSLGISILVISCINPYAAGSVSLQLSVLATLGVILCNEYIIPHINAFTERHSAFAYIEKPVKLLAVTACAVFFTVPVTLPVYHSFSPAVFPSNLFIVGLAEVCMMASAVGAVIAFFTVSIPNIPAFIAGILAKVILKTASVISGLNLFTAYVSESDAYLILCFVFVISAVFLIIYYAGKRKALSAFVIIPAVFIITVFSFSYIDSLRTEIRVLDIEGGKNVLVSYKNENILIGCSGEDSGGLYDIEDAAGSRGGSLDSVAVTDTSCFSPSYFKAIISKYNPSHVYIKNPDYSTSLLIPGESKAASPEECSTEKIKIIPVRDSGGSEAIVVRTDEMKAVIFFESIDVSSADYDISDCDAVIICSDEIPASRFTSLSATVICADAETGAKLQSSLSSSGINASATAGMGDVAVYGYRNRITIERG